MFSRIFGMLIRGNLRGLLSFLLGLALLGAFWNASLYRLSSHDSATGIMTQVGIQVINPVLTGSGVGGLSQSAYTTLQKNCASTATVPGLKVSVPCSRIKGASLTTATSAIYSAVAEGYYQDGVKGVFDVSVPGPIMDILSGKSIIPQVNTVPTPGGQSVSVPHLPDNPLFQLGSAVGFSFGTLTAAGHADEQSKTLWFGGAALLLLLLLGLTSKGGKRLSAMGHALIGGAVPGLVGTGLVIFLTKQYPSQTAPFTKLLGFIGGAFVPVYVGAAVLGVLLYFGAAIWKMVVKPVASSVREAVPAAVGAVARPRAGEAGGGGRGGYGGTGGYGEPQPRYQAPRYQEPQPRYGDPRPPLYTPPQPPMPSGPQGPQYPPRTPDSNAWNTPSRPGQQPPAGPTWPAPQNSSQNPGWQTPTQDMPPSRGNDPYASQGQYPPRQPGYPGTPPAPRQSPRSAWLNDDGQQPGQSGWGNDDAWPPRR